MTQGERLRVVICWHMHQPEYRDFVSGRWLLPWTYLHGLKDYSDMAAQLEAEPRARAVVNFSPILLEQLRAYVDALATALRGGAAPADPLLEALAMQSLPQAPAQRGHLAQMCLRSHAVHMVRRFEPYERLTEIAERIAASARPDYLSDQLLADLLVWFHLAWLGESLRGREVVQRLAAKGGGYDAGDRRGLLGEIAEVLAGLAGRYRRLAESGQIELSTSPYAHPILPLLLDFAAVREAQPEAALPRWPAYPGGRARAAWHLERAVQCFAEFFGGRPHGCWPSEGAVSAGTLALLEEHGFEWAATGGVVLRHSLAAQSADATPAVWHRPYRLPDHRLGCFFRDDGLSDLIGFVYSKWEAADAVADLLGHLARIAAEPAAGPRVVSLVLDGENPWEYYPRNGEAFLRLLYAQLAEDPRFRLTTFADCLRELEPAVLRDLVAGSWVHGTLTTWIGVPDKNAGWDRLCEAKVAYDRVVAGRPLQPSERAGLDRQLAVCEGSDWCWWFGAENPPRTVQEFDELYRRHLSGLYVALGEPPPAQLAEPLSRGGGGAELGGVMKRGD